MNQVRSTVPERALVGGRMRPSNRHQIGNVSSGGSHALCSPGRCASGSFSVLRPSAARAQANPDWHPAISGVRIAGNLYYVGTADLAVYLVNTPTRTPLSALTSHGTMSIELIEHKTR
jgi:hypothetical protein